MKSKSDLEKYLETQLKQIGLSMEREYSFAKSIGRRWRFDFADPERKIAIEIQGGVYGKRVICNHCGMPVTNENGKPIIAAGGAHSRGKGQERDFEKNNHAILLGWKVFYFSGQQIKSDEAILFLMDYKNGQLHNLDN